MEFEFDRMQRANAALEAWIRDLLSENKELRRRLAFTAERGEDGLAAAAGVPACAAA